MSTSGPSAEPVPARGGAYDYRGDVRWEYRPRLDRDPDPGEVVWTWVVFEDDPSIGKDRPVAVVGEADGGRLAVLMLSSRGHDGERGWLAIGAGPWDPRGRPSWVRLDRMLAVPPAAVRREGAVLARPTYDAIAAALGGRLGAAGGSARPGGVLARLRRLLRPRRS